MAPPCRCGHLTGAVVAAASARLEPSFEYWQSAANTPQMDLL